MGYKGRDVEVSMLEQGLCLVVACDSCGAIGEKKLDLLKVPHPLVGQLTARVALMEVLCTGAVPRVMTVAISSEPEPTGRQILNGVRQELETAGFKDLSLVISTEKNFVPSQTGLGIGVTGSCRINDLRIAGSGPGDGVYCLGIPRVGQEVAKAPASSIIGTAQIRELLAQPDIHDIVPVGSRGILAEARELACHTHSRFIPDASMEVDLNKSAGPSTCALFTCAPETVPQIQGNLPLFRVGSLVGS
ncbi:alpha-ribazole kinase [Desulfocicer vacuolatum DSM 3385]|uniref:Alpha-ribazole kinase n=1 Tax=Desulfocicer vacuolatum DSM 3385 TaxID=1121400 RepID=A0A1W2EMF7_9BACT|nr:AIR synthase related protein [Desulfocicer vacuolatum]SMD10702.1 alpha-ribazole kinase [Desulfocicer vacuolatum DSM 3385]